MSTIRSYRDLDAWKMAMRLDTQLELAVEFEFVSRNDVVEATDLSRQLGRLVLALVRALESTRAS